MGRAFASTVATWKFESDYDLTPANMIYASGSSAEDKAAVGRINDFNMGWFGAPWRDDGDYPETLRDTLGDLLPKFTQQQKNMLKGSCDFYAIDATNRRLYGTGKYVVDVVRSNRDYVRHGCPPSGPTT